MDDTAPKRYTVLITGGAGFLGRAIVRELLEHPQRAGIHPRQIRVFDLDPYKLLRYGDIAEAKCLRFVRGDIRDGEKLLKAVEGVDVVIHCAASVDWAPHRKKALHEINVSGTENVIRACVENDVKALVHTSTLDVVYTGKPIRDADERQPYAQNHVTDYCATKTVAEKSVLAANGLTQKDDGSLRRGPLATTALRPGGMFGEADPFHISSLIHLAKKRMLFRIGDGSAKFQHVYVGNVAHALLMAARDLLEGEAASAGKAYFVTDFPAANFFEYLEPIITGAGYKMHPKAWSLPRDPMYGLGWLVEKVSALVSPVFPFTPTVSRFSVNFLCVDFTFKTDKAKRDFGYEPVYSEREAITRTTRWFRTHGPV